MKKKKCILLFDDKDQKNIINSIVASTQQEFDLEFIFIRTSSPNLKKNDSEDLDITKLEEKINPVLRGYVESVKFDLGKTTPKINSFFFVWKI